VSKNGIRPVYAVSPFEQHAYGIGNFLSGLFRTVTPILWSGVGALGHEALRNGGNVMTDLAANKSTDGKACDIVARCLGGSAQNLIQEIRGKGKRKCAAPKLRKSRTKSGKPPKKKAKLTKRDIFA
jgi:hypothetical protein